MADKDKPEYDFDRHEIEAIKFMIEEIDLTLHHTHRYRARFEMIQDQFYSSGGLPEKYKKMLIHIYELITDVDFDPGKDN